MGRFGQENRWHHHDRIARTGALGGGRACAVWSIGCSEKPPVPDDLAVDLPAAADVPPGGVVAGCTRFTPASNRIGNTRAAPFPGKRKARPFLLQGNRLYWFLTILAATAVATMIVGRMMISSGTGPGLAH